jgi:hypothetical protein
MARSKKARPELQQACDILRECERVPTRARRFHRERNEIDSRIRTLLARWWMVWIDDNELLRLNEATRRLGRITDSLVELCRKAEQLEGDIQRLADDTARLGDDDLSGWFSGVCESRLVRLRRLGADSDREAELFHEHQEIVTIEEWVRFHLQAVSWLRKAITVQAELAASMHEPAVALRDGLPPLKEQLQSEAADHSWLEQLKELVAAADELVQRSQDPPRGLQTVKQLLQEMHGWSHQLGEHRRELEELEQQHDLVTQDWLQLDRESVKESVNEVLTRAEDLAARLRQRSQELRHTALRRIEEQMLELVESCGPQPDLEQRIEPLRSQAVRLPPQHASWLRRCQETENLFISIAESHELTLEQRLQAEISELSKSLQDLRDQPISDEVSREADRVQDETDKLHLLAGAIGMLEGLQRIKTLKSTIEQLVYQAGQDKNELDRRQQALKQQNDMLQEQSALLDLELADYSSRISRLSEDDQLEVARSAADELATELEEQQQLLLSLCRQRLDRQHQHVQRTMQALNAAGCPPVEDFEQPDMERVIAPGTEPPQAAAAVLAGEQHGQKLSTLVEHAVRHLDQQRQDRLAEMQATPAETLPPGEREDAEQLLEELREGSWSYTDEPVQQLHLLAELLARCRLHLDSLKSEQMQADSCLQNLRRRLQRFKENHLRRFCPELTDRVTSLVFGVPDLCRDWEVAGAQLALAEQLLASLELQAPRQAVRDLEDHAQSLRRQVQCLAEDDPAAQEARAVLDELEQLSPYQLPSAGLRMRVRNLVSLPSGTP